MSEKRSSVYTYDLLGTIGHGNFSVCKLAQHKITGQKYAIKCIDKKSLDDLKLSRIYREIEIMKMLDHPNIIKLNQVMESRSMLYLVSEYSSNGEIFDYILKNGAMSEKLACEKFCQIISAVEYCHLKNIVHRDLKIENLLLDHNLNVKLVDFGFANYFDLKNHLSTFCGSPPYAAPEIFIGKKYYGPEIDIWSLGVILYVLVSASLPFDSENLQRLKNLVLTCKYRIPYFLSQECEHLIKNLLVVNPSKRFKLQQIKAHKWIKINNSTFYYKNNNFNKEVLNIEPNETQKSKSKKFNRISNKFKSKSLKNISLDEPEVANENEKLTKSYLSLPLYSYEESIKKPDSNEIVNLVNNLNLQNKAEEIIKKDEITIKPHEHHNCTLSLESHLKCAAFSKLISNSSSLDEGVESDYSLSSSISNDVLSNSKTSFNSIQVTSFESQSSQKSSQLSIDLDTPRIKTPKAFMKFNQALIRRYKFSNIRKTFLKPSNPKSNNYVNDLTSIKRELNNLIKNNLKNNNLNKINECPNMIGHSSSSQEASPRHDVNVETKFFAKILKKESKSQPSETVNTNCTTNHKKMFFRQKSTSLNSVSIDDANLDSMLVNSPNKTRDIENKIVINPNNKNPIWKTHRKNSLKF